MAERDPYDGRPATGGDIEPAQNRAPVWPATDAAPDVTAHQQPGQDLSSIPTPPMGIPVVPSPPSPPAQSPTPPSKLKQWLETPGLKFVGALFVIVVLLMVIQSAIGSITSENRPPPASSADRYTLPELLSARPTEVVRRLYFRIANPDGDLACHYFDEAARQQFAANLGFANCQDAIRSLHGQVTVRREYGESIPAVLPQVPSENTYQVSSCAYGIKGGPSLGAFTLSKIEMGLWRITAHALEPNPCPPKPSPSNTRSRSSTGTSEGSSGRTTSREPSISEGAQPTN